jgi:hypothetical protein
MDEDKIKAMNLFREFKQEREQAIESKMEALSKLLGEVEPTPIQELHDLEQALFQLGNVHSAFTTWLMDREDQIPSFRFDEKKWYKL